MHIIYLMVFSIANILMFGWLQDQPMEEWQKTLALYSVMCFVAYLIYTVNSIIEEGKGE